MKKTVKSKFGPVEFPRGWGGMRLDEVEMNGVTIQSAAASV